MRKLLNIALVVFVALSSVSCVLRDESFRSTRYLATTLWYESKEHIDVVRCGIEDAIHIGNLMLLDDTDEQAQYLEAHFAGATLSTTESGCVVTMPTDYETTLTWNVATNGCAFGKGEWRVSRSGGQAYELIISPDISGDLIAEYKSYYRGAQQGEAFIRFSYEEEGESAGIQGAYIGNIEVVDARESAKNPLYLSIDIRQPLIISEHFGIVSGEVDIVCVDKLYDSKDEINVKINKSNRKTVIRCYGDSYVLD